MITKVKTLEDHRVSISSLNLLAESPVKYAKHILKPQEVDSEPFRKGGKGMKSGRKYIAIIGL